MAGLHVAVYPWGVELALALTAAGKAAIVLVFTGVAAPLAGILFRRVGGGWGSLGGGPFSLLREQPERRPAGPARAIDPAIQAAEVRQMLEAKSERRQRRGEAALDVETETERLLAETRSASDPEDALGAELRAEVRQLVIARNERRMRAGTAPLDVEAETERQLADLVGSS
jgi:hypothetical protein